MFSVGRFFLNLVFPLCCETCDRPLSTSSFGVCADCEAEIRKIEPPFCPTCARTAHLEPHTGHFYFDRAYACAWYDGRVKELIHIYKYKSRKHLQNFFGNLLLGFIDQHLDKNSFDAILSVPISKQKERLRGFNQSFLISRRIAKDLQKQELSRFISRKNSQTAQALLTKEMRRQNVRDAFRIHDATPFQNKRLLLVDDILTTGLTASECGRLLKSAGAREITVLTCARGL